MKIQAWLKVIVTLTQAAFLRIQFLASVKPLFKKNFTNENNANNINVHKNHHNQEVYLNQN